MIGVSIGQADAKSIYGVELGRALPLLHNTIVFEQSTHKLVEFLSEGAAVGDNFVITDSEGRAVLKGVIKSQKTIFIPVGKLSKGYYHLQVGNQVLQQFIIE